MIKSKVSLASKNDYPKIMKSKNSGLVVLFSKSELGTVILGNELHDCGEFSDDWDMSSFTDFDGSITLSNGSK